VPERVVAVLGRGLVAADTPILRADDLGALRGDGIFETMHVRPVPPDGAAAAGEPQPGPARSTAATGRIWLIDEHLARLAGSAALLDLHLPDRAALLELAGQAVGGWPANAEGALRLVCTRGAEGGGPVTAFATLAAVSAPIRRARREGIAVLTASLGFAADARTSAPWLLGGAKTLSYAVNMASQRWAAEQGVDDLLWVSGDGYALEAPTSTLVWLAEGTLWTVPAQTTGILAGITAAWLLDHAGELGYAAGTRMIRPADLTSVDGVWLASSVRGLAEVRTLDGKPLQPANDTTRMLTLLGF
jgi:4-amino-4-deoxychorismate lyase